MTRVSRVPDAPAKSWRRRACMLAGVAVLALSGCVTPAVPDLGVAGQRTWQGRFSITMTSPPEALAATQEANEERAQGRFAITRRKNTIKLELYSPFGQTIASATSDPVAGAVLTTSDGQRFVAADPDTLIEQALGWRLPVSVLPEWLAGTELGPTSEARVLEGWSVKAEQRFDNGTPRRIAAKWPASQRYGERRINLFLVVDRTS